MTENTELMTVDNICNQVYVIRGQQVKRNIDRFPEDFMFQLKKEEVPKEFSKSQIVTLNEKGDKRGTNIKKMPYAFTEQGIYMLATVLKGKTKRNVSLRCDRYKKRNEQPFGVLRLYSAQNPFLGEDSITN